MVAGLVFYWPGKKSEGVARLQLKVFVDDRHREVRRRGEQGVDAVLLQGGNNEALLIFKFLGNGALIDVLGGVAGLGQGFFPGMGEGAQVVVFKEHHEQAMALGELPQVGQLAAHGVERAETGEEHQQRPARDMAAHGGAKGREVGLGKVRLLGVEGLQELLHVVAAPVGGHHGVLLLGKGDEPGIVLLANGHEGEGQGGVDAVVEEGHAGKGLLHDAPLVDDAVHALRPLVLVDVDHELVAAGRGFPVDGAEVVAGDVFLNVLKLRLVANSPDALRAVLREVVADGQQLILPQPEERRVNGHVLRLALRVPALHQLQRSADKNAYVAEVVNAAASGTQAIDNGLVAPWRKAGAVGNVAALEDERRLVDDFQPDGEPVVALQL